MARTALLAILCLSGIAASCAAPGFRTWIRFSSGSGDEPAEPSCLTYTDQDSCLEHACGWCSSSVLGDLGCVAEGLAKLVPQSVAECKLSEQPADDDDDDDDDDDAHDDDEEEDEDEDDEDDEADKPDKPKPKPPTSCGDNKERRDCLKMGAEEGDCAWCEGDFMPASCVGVKAAEWIPEQVAKCKMPKKHKKDDAELAADKPEPKPKPPTSCGDNKERRDCLKMGAEEGDCAWCEGDFMPASCVGVKAAEWIPEQVAKCKMPKKHKKDDADLAADKPEPKPKPPTSCGDNKERRDCLKMGAEEGDCAWCEGDFMPASCVGVKAAEWIPEQVAKCKMPKKHKKDDADLAADKPDPKPKPPTSCGDNKERRDCLEMGAEEGDCAWCEGDFMPASCVGVKAAEWIPEQVAKCKMPKKHRDEEDSLEKKKKKKTAATCMEIKDSRECVERGADEGECAWCAGKFLPDGCIGVDKAKFIPEQVATCKMPKHDDDLAATSLDRKHHKKGGKSGGGGWIPGGGDWPSGGGDYPSGGGDYPGPGGGGYGPGDGGQGQGCMALKSKKKCLKGTDTEACAWCGASSFLGSPCVSESTAKYMPSFVAKCKAGKGPKKNDAEKLAVA